MLRKVSLQPSISPLAARAYRAPFHQSWPTTSTVRIVTRFTNNFSVFESDYEDLRRSGYSREGLHSRGIRLGSALRITFSLRAREAAEKMRAEGSGGGRRLGARTIGGGRGQLTPRELALKASVVSRPSLSLWDPSFCALLVNDTGKF